MTPIYDTDGKLTLESMAEIKDEFYYWIEQEGADSPADLPNDIRLVAEKHRDVWDEAQLDVGKAVLAMWKAVAARIHPTH